MAALDSTSAACYRRRVVLDAPDSSQLRSAGKARISHGTRSDCAKSYDSAFRSSWPGPERGLPGQEFCAYKGPEVPHVIVRKFPIEHLDPVNLLGQNDAHLRQIERSLPVRITLRDGTITVAGEEEPVGSASAAL